MSVIGGHRQMRRCLPRQNHACLAADVAVPFTGTSGGA
jgi:hypothetical protein